MSANRSFKLKLSHPTMQLPGQWLARKRHDAMAYQSYCGMTNDEQDADVYTWYHLSDGKPYLQSQESYWLSHGSEGRLYMSFEHYAVAWRIENERLIRDSDGAVMSWDPNQSWPLADSTDFVEVDAAGDRALTVTVVEIELTEVEKLLKDMTAVYTKRHANPDADPPDRYLYRASGAEGSAVADIEGYTGNAVAFFALRTSQVGTDTVPVYLLRMNSERTYFKLSLSIEEAGYTLDPGEGGKPNFYAFPSASTQAFLVQIYEHSAENPTAGQQRFIYDTLAEAHSNWSAGVPVFRAIPMSEAEKALIGTVGSESAWNYANDWAKKHSDQVESLVKQLGTKDNLNNDVVKEFDKLFEPETRYRTLGAGFHGGYGVGAAGVEFGSIWLQEDFGYTPMRTPISDYSVEWVTYGLTGVDIGIGIDAVSFGTWFGDISQIEGACNGITIGMAIGAGLTVTLFWDGSWQGANFTSYPIGYAGIVGIGLELGGGVFWNASATQFYNRRPNFPKG